jgi:CBS domain-containing protein
MTQYAELDLIRTCRPVCLPPTATVMMAARHMHSRNVSAVLVTDDDGSLVGIFTERDAISRVLAEGKDPVATFLGEVMTDNPDTVRPDESPAQVVSRMRTAQCRHLPIVHDGNLLGMFSRGQRSVEPTLVGFAAEAAN